MSNSETSTTSIGLGSVIEEGDMVSDEEKNIEDDMSRNCTRICITLLLINCNSTVCFFEGENSNVHLRQGKNYFWTKQLVSFFQ